MKIRHIKKAGGIIYHSKKFATLKIKKQTKGTDKNISKKSLFNI